MSVYRKPLFRRNARRRWVDSVTAQHPRRECIFVEHGIRLFDRFPVRAVIVAKPGDLIRDLEKARIRLNTRRPLGDNPVDREPTLSNLFARIERELRQDAPRARIRRRFSPRHFDYIVQITLQHTHEAAPPSSTQHDKPIFETLKVMDLRDYALEHVAGALIDEIPRADRGELRERAFSLLAIAEAAAVPIEELLQWIRTPAPEKEYSLREWRAYCQQRPVQGALFEAPPASSADAFEPRPRR